jgi:hypothetical protein
MKKIVFVAIIAVIVIAAIFVFLNNRPVAKTGENPTGSTSTNVQPSPSGTTSTNSNGDNTNTNQQPGVKTFVYPGTTIEIGKHGEVNIPNTQKYLSIYNPANQNDTQTLYLIDTGTNSIKVVGKLSGNESYAAYPLHSTATPAPYAINVFFPSGPDIPYESVAAIKVFDMTKVGEEDTRSEVRTEQIKL